MPFIDLNQARLYYEYFGPDDPHLTPILLIHGSTGTGASNWRLAAPLLARKRPVIVPDCRGHGQSSNPRSSYSFKELAGDMVGLVRALGFEHAHIIGHSNGGNVALVMLLEHPDVIQTAVLQAANAYVSADLVEKEPAIFDPERVAKEDPAWRDEMIALHSQTHGDDYWRKLLKITVDEIISQPNYTSEELGTILRPTLVIQGEHDRVNAPARHAQFIAEHIPFAELWLPAGVGHTVHDEKLFEWINRVEDFLERRDDEANDALYRLRRAHFADRRETIFELRAEETNQAGMRRLTGRVLHATQLGPVRQSLAKYRVDDSDVQVLLEERTPWALVNRPVDDLRREPDSLAERISQVLHGEVVRILQPGEVWSWVRLEADGYLGWVHTRSLYPCSAAEAHTYRTACNALVTNEMMEAYLEPTRASGLGAGKLPFGVLVTVIDRLDEWAAIRLPDGRQWWSQSADLLALEQRPKANPVGIDRALNLIQRFIGVPYLWGGRSPFGYDCSGLAQAFYGFLGVQLPRDADQQMYSAIPVEGEPQAGDLLFFGQANGAGHRPISHVAISLGGLEVIHANGAAWGVSYNSLDPDSRLYRDWLRQNLVGMGHFR
jgi:pimeloyl-ACP methyl ester carboxylesterase/cell wall-associated NlpC family hydrolase